jgi:hypothetical protein
MLCTLKLLQGCAGNIEKCARALTHVEHELYYIPVLQIANQDSEIIYYAYSYNCLIFFIFS